MEAGLKSISSDPLLQKHVRDTVSRLFSRVDESLGLRGWGGEVLAAYAIENEPNPHSSQVVVSNATWFDNPYRIDHGADMVGVDLVTGTFCLIEVKASKVSKTRTKTLNNLKEDLKMARARDRWTSPHRDGCNDLLAELVDRRRKGEGFPGGQAVPDAMHIDHFHRIGVVACTDAAAWRSVLDACPHDAEAPGWLHLKLVSVADFDEFLKQAIAMEEAIKVGVVANA